MTKKRMFVFDSKYKFTANIEGASTQTGTPTPTSPIDVIPLQTDPTTERNISSFNLHGAGTYKDIYNYLTKKITRNIGILALNGTETWQESSGEYYFNIPRLNGTTSWVGFSTHFPCTNAAGGASGKFHFGGGATNNGNVLFYVSESYTLSEWTNWLAAQYAAGTPVIVYYPLTTTVEEDAPILTRFSIGETKNYSIPEEYTEIQYIDGGTNGSYIDTGYIPTTGSSVTINFKGGFKSGSSRRFILGEKINTRTHYVEFNASNQFGSYSCLSTASEANVLYDLSITFASQNIFTQVIDGQKLIGTASDATSTTWTMPITLMTALDASGTASNLLLGIVECYENAILTHLYVPCKDSNNAVGIYDKVDKVFIAAIGTLNPGPDSEDPKYTINNFIPETES